MNQTNVPQQFLWAVSLAVTMWLVVSGAVWAGEGAALRVGETQWQGVTVELTSIEPASGEMLMVKFTYVNRGSAVAQFRMKDVYYVDTRNRIKYSPVGDGSRLLASVDSGYKRIDVAPGQSASHWVKFPAPRAGVERIDLYFPSALPMENVPIR